MIKGYWSPWAASQDHPEGRITWEAFQAYYDDAGHPEKEHLGVRPLRFREFGGLKDGKGS